MHLRSKSAQTIRCAQRIDLHNNVVAVVPFNRRVRGVIHFVAGAFAGALPYQSYGALLHRLADAGYTVIATPYAVTFEHKVCAECLHSDFLSALDDIRSRDGMSRWVAPQSVPIHGLGHSNGALIHAMIASLFAPDNVSNVLISFNNRQVVEAVPVPLTSLQAGLQPVRAIDTLANLAKRSISLTLDVVEALENQGGSGGELSKFVKEFAPAAVQVGSVLDEIGDGLVDFSPTPENNRLLFNASYAVDRTLVIRYSDDSIDQSPSLVEVLTSPQVAQNPRYVEQRILPGTHLTPVSPFTPFTTKRDFDPVVALSQAALSMSQRDLALTAREIITWLDNR